MKKLIALVVMACATAFGSTPSYWFSQWQVKPDAAQAQDFFCLPGTGINFTYSNNRFIINATGGGANTNYVLKSGDTMTGPLTMSGGNIVFNGGAISNAVYISDNLGDFMYGGNIQDNYGDYLAAGYVRAVNGFIGGFLHGANGFPGIDLVPIVGGNDIVLGGTIYGNGAGLSNILSSTYSKYSTNWLGSNAMWNAVVSPTNDFFWKSDGAGGTSNTLVNTLTINVGGGGAVFTPGVYANVILGGNTDYITPGNTIIPAFTRGSAIGGGGGNSITGTGIGPPAQALASYVTLSGGELNAVTNSPGSTIGGGVGNYINGMFGCTLSGGNNNKVGFLLPYSGGASGASVGGGNRNWAGGDASTVAGGENNIANGPGSSVGGGGDNTSLGYCSVISGGLTNLCTNNLGSVSGGINNTNYGYAAVIPGGAMNQVASAASYSFAAGSNALAAHLGSLVWNDGSAGPYSSPGNNSVSFHAAGGMRLDGGQYNGNGYGITNLHIIPGTNTFISTNASGYPVVNVTINTNSVATNNIIPGPQKTVLATIGGVTAWTGLPAITNLNLEPTLSLNSGTINQGGVNWLSTFGTGNLFIGAAGSPSGNFTMSGSYNLGFGRLALGALTSGIGNVGLGNAALFADTSGGGNMALGSSALQSVTVGGANVAIGQTALVSLSGVAGVTSYEVAIGDSSLYNLGTGAGNTGVGRATGYSLTSGSYNVFIGYGTGFNASQKVNPVNSTAIGANAYTTADNQVVIGNATTQVIVNGNLNVNGVGVLTNGVYFQQGTNTAPTAASIGGTVGSITNHLMKNVNGVLVDYWSDGTTLWSKQLAP